MSSNKRVQLGIVQLSFAQNVYDNGVRLSSKLIWDIMLEEKAISGPSHKLRLMSQKQIPFSSHGSIKARYADAKHDVKLPAIHGI